MTDIGPNLVGNVAVNLALLKSQSENLDWLVDGDQLELELGTLFKGSSSGVGCVGNCYCLGFYQKN